MGEVGLLNRQMMGCGWAPPAPSGVPVMLWRHEGMRADTAVTVCAGYSCGLSEVIEVSLARAWSREHRQLEHWADGTPTRALIRAIQILDGSSAQRDAWEIKNPKRDG